MDRVSSSEPLGGVFRWTLGAGRAAARLALLAAVLSLGSCATPPPQRAESRLELPRAEKDLTAAKSSSNAIWIDSLDLSAVEQEWGKPRAGRSVEDHPMTLGGYVFAHGLGTHSNSEFVIDLNGAAERFRSIVGVDDDSKTHGSVVFIVLVDGRELYRSPVLRGRGKCEVVSVPLRGAKQMTLATEDAGDGIDYDHADWAGAQIVLSRKAHGQVLSHRLPPEEVPPIARGDAPEPVIHAPRITGGSPGMDFLFRIPATGEPPLQFEAQNLPAGLMLDPSAGIISGKLPAAGRQDVAITVTGPKGRATSTLSIVSGPRSLAFTPPMGWNSWNVWGTAVDDAKVRAAADALVDSGLAAHGFQYVNIDDAWEGVRDSDGRIQSNQEFPDMRALADYVHSKGLKLGIYSSPGPKTCAGFEGSYQHEPLDAQQYAAWGVDLIKYDLCSYREILPDRSLAELKKPYEIMRAALDTCGRDIVYSLCQYGMGNVSQWGEEVGGNYWRTTGDISDSWASMAGIGFGQNGLEAYAGPGHWNDPDMLVVGYLGWGEDMRPTHLTPNEQITHITLWSLLASPLLIGCDLTRLDDFTKALLTNPEVLEVSQDPLGAQGRRVWVEGRREVWARPLADGSIAVGLFNRGSLPAKVTAEWSNLEVSGPRRVRNLWLRKDEGTFGDSFSAEVPRHGAVMLRLATP